MREQSLVSIVLPTYNGARYLRESLDSVLAQTYENWELIIVNDCSTDESLAIAEEYAARDSRIRIISNAENQKLPRSLNIGFREAKGKYLTWTSDDNRFLPEAITAMVDFLECETVCPLVCAQMDYVDGNGQIIGRSTPYQDYDIWYRNLVGACFMYRREVLAAVGEYDTDFIYVEDYDYWLRIRATMGTIGYIPRVLYQYRYHETSLTTTKRRAINYQTARLWPKYREKVISAYCEDEERILAIYYGLIGVNLEAEELLADIRKLLPALKNERLALPTGSVFLFGAGIIGGRALKLLGDSVVGFIDNNSLKVGAMVEGRSVISWSEYCAKYAASSEVVVTVAIDKILPLIEQVLEDIDHYYTYWGMKSKLEGIFND